MRGIMDADADPEVRETVFMKASQIAGTECINNKVGYHIHQDPAPMLVIQPTLAVGKAWSNDRLAPMIRDTPELASIFDNIRSRDRNNTQLYKKFPGGHVTVAGANSPSSLSSRPIRVVLGDEVDRYPASAGDEGDPLSLAYKRTSAFWNRKRFICSTPTLAGHSRIEEAYEQSDKRRFYVPCQDCGEFHVLKWPQVKWTEGKPGTARYVCEDCGSLWDDSERIDLIGGGDWRATAPFEGIAGFHISQIYSPFVELREMVEEFVGAQGNPQRLKVFVNTGLGETWKEKGEAPEWRRLYDRAEDWKPATCPSGVLFLTAGVDVQRMPARIEVYVWGWGRGLESWLVDHIILEGDAYETAVWDKLDTVMAQSWPHESGAHLSLSKLAIDSGYATTQVYAWVRKQGPGRTIAVKGTDFGATGVGVPKMTDIGHSRSKTKRKYRGVAVWPVVGGIYKAEFYGFLRLDPPTRESEDPHPPGFVHLPKLSEETFQQLVSEQLVSKIVKHRRSYKWEKTRERNEALDARVYARAAAAVYGVDQFQERHWAALEAHLVTRKADKPLPPRGGGRRSRGAVSGFMSH